MCGALRPRPQGANKKRAIALANHVCIHSASHRNRRRFSLRRASSWAITNSSTIHCDSTCKCVAEAAVNDLDGRQRGVGDGGRPRLTMLCVFYTLCCCTRTYVLNENKFENAASVENRLQQLYGRKIEPQLRARLRPYARSCAPAQQSTYLHTSGKQTTYA